ncbi:MAG: 3-phosphoshikimate 1-carboxyvinyltransferase [Planctomycetes bacterium]|nr:3-phosphoshikimate 1-carboxyvinyltransferase [Planctomycetota bacterium]
MTDLPVVEVRPLAMPFDLELELPGAKSLANRALVAACLAPGRTVIDNATPGEDVELMVTNLRRLGFDVRWRDRPSGRVEVDGGLPTGRGSAVLDCGNAGTTLRFLTALAALVPGDWVVTGSARMQQRPIGPLVRALRSLGAELEDRDGCPPITIRGGTLRGGRVAIDTRVSSQFASALALVAPAAPDGIELGIDNAASRPYLALTQKVMAAFGVTAAGRRYASPGHHAIEADWSAAGAFLVLAELTGSRVRTANLDPASDQPDRSLPEVIIAMRRPGDLIVDCAGTPDQLMNLAVLAAHRAGATRFVGASNLRHKECDRLEVLARELGKVGVDIEQHDDGVVVGPSPTLRAARLDPCGDHRMAMAFAVLGSMHAGIAIEDPGCVAKSYPAFFADLARIHCAPPCLALVGMRGAGKSTFGAELARALGLPCIDVDAEFERRHGAIAAFVAAAGWSRFRELEERLVDESLRPGHVIALGGGAVLSRRTRQRLRDRALVVHLDEELATLERRNAGGDRPALTDRGVVGEVAAVLAERQPLYREVADVTLPPGRTPAQWVATLQRELRARCSW